MNESDVLARELDRTDKQIETLLKKRKSLADQQKRMANMEFARALKEVYPDKEQIRRLAHEKAMEGKGSGA